MDSTMQINLQYKPHVQLAPTWNDVKTPKSSSGSSLPPEGSSAPSVSPPSMLGARASRSRVWGRVRMTACVHVPFERWHITGRSIMRYDKMPEHAHMCITAVLRYTQEGAVRQDRGCNCLTCQPGQKLRCLPFPSVFPDALSRPWPLRTKDKLLSGPWD